uniref:NADH:ubiquinone reductase (H(+)-translocating) n=1 Tax=Amphimedon queenslandica TaxID=400682 RepID=A0A1X7VSU5_AMPQE
LPSGIILPIVATLQAPLTTAKAMGGLLPTGTPLDGRLYPILTYEGAVTLCGYILFIETDLAHAGLNSNHVTAIQHRGRKHRLHCSGKYVRKYPNPFHTTININKLKINGKYFCPGFPKLSYAIPLIFAYANSIMDCQTFGITRFPIRNSNITINAPLIINQVFRCIHKFSNKNTESMFHIWLPQAHIKAPVAASVILA